MKWIAPAEKDAATITLEKRLWDAADQFRANSGLKAQEYSGPILGLIFLRFAEVRFAAQKAKLEKASSSSRRGSRVDEPAAYHADNVLYLAPEARFDHLLTLPEGADIGGKVNAQAGNRGHPRHATERLRPATVRAEVLGAVRACLRELPGAECGGLCVTYPAQHFGEGRADIQRLTQPDDGWNWWRRSSDKTPALVERARTANWLIPAGQFDQQNLGQVQVACTRTGTHSEEGGRKALIYGGFWEFFLFCIGRLCDRLVPTPLWR